MLNTQGGPRRNGKGQVVRPDRGSETHDDYIDFSIPVSRDVDTGHVLLRTFFGK